MDEETRPRLAASSGQGVSGHWWQSRSRAGLVTGLCGTGVSYCRSCFSYQVDESDCDCLFPLLLLSPCVAADTWLYQLPFSLQELGPRKGSQA